MSNTIEELLKGLVWSLKYITVARRFQGDTYRRMPRVALPGTPFLRVFCTCVRFTQSDLQGRSSLISIAPLSLSR